MIDGSLLLQLLHAADRDDDDVALAMALDYLTECGAGQRTRRTLRMMLAYRRFMMTRSVWGSARGRVAYWSPCIGTCPRADRLSRWLTEQRCVPARTISRIRGVVLGWYPQCVIF